MTSSQKTILIVDDNLEDRHTYHRYLKQDPICTYNIIEAETGEEGLERFFRHHPDLILLDFNLPDLDGLEFVAKLKESYAQLRGSLPDRLPPIIVLTGEGNEEIAVKVMKAGVKDYLTKGNTNANSLRFTIRSVLEQVRLHQLAQRNEHKFRVSVENMLDCFGIYTSIRDENFQIIGFRPDYLNESACKNNLFDWQRQKESNTCLLNIFDFQGELFSLCCEVIETGKAVSREFFLKSQEPENQAKVFEIRIDRLEDGFIAVWRNITERKQIEKALQQSEARFRVLVTQAPVGIFQTNCQGDCVYVNPRWLEITGLSQAEALGQGWSNALHPEDKARVYQQWYETAQLGTEFTSEYRFQSPDGTITWVSGKAVIMYGDRGERIGYFGTIIDISERKRAEALSKEQKERLISINQDLEQTTSLLKKRNRELDEFTYIVSHDLKAPLRAIRNLSEWIEEDLEDKLDDDIRQNLKLLKSRVGRMQMFIQSLLKYSRVGREQSPTEIVAVKDLLMDIIDSIAPPPKFAIAIDESMPTLNTQKIALEQVFSNLISNGIKHHHSQAGKIEISATETPQFYYFAVTDDGDGIALEHQERIFGIFQTLSSRDHNESSGIGLSIVKKIVESQGGTIELESQVGKGTTFSFSWRK
ncbi:PAS domain S-box protein [Pleurocapsa sp. PCC 7319]|uniref:PAS domain S-box protein n=1 Tax=Pleurocapsa sp. PCC 7319 TaxID=118161 RepID=UPI00034631EE|nr:PAS domain S-box protein [Pleurocapsa sp. PCC 7319]